MPGVSRDSCPSAMMKKSNFLKVGQRVGLPEVAPAGLSLDSAPRASPSAPFSLVGDTRSPLPPGPQMVSRAAVGPAEPVPARPPFTRSEGPTGATGTVTPSLPQGPSCAGSPGPPGSPCCCDASWSGGLGAGGSSRTPGTPAFSPASSPPCSSLHWVAQLQEGLDQRKWVKEKDAVHKA